MKTTILIIVSGIILFIGSIAVGNFIKEQQREERNKIFNEKSQPQQELNQKSIPSQQPTQQQVPQKVYVQPQQSKTLNLPAPHIWELPSAPQLELNIPDKYLDTTAPIARQRCDYSPLGQKYNCRWLNPWEY